MFDRSLAGHCAGFFDRINSKRYHRRLMSDQLPERIEPFALAEQRASFEGDLPIDSLPRLRELAAPGALLRVKLRFGAADHGRPLLTGAFSTTLNLTCQRCLGPMELKLDGDIRLALVHDLEEADRLADCHDVLVVADRAMALSGILEDEVLLAVPTAPLHALDECPGARIDTTSAADEFADAEAPRSNPFAMLAELKKDPGDGPP